MLKAKIMLGRRTEVSILHSVNLTFYNILTLCVEHLKMKALLAKLDKASIKDIYQQVQDQ